MGFRRRLVRRRHLIQADSEGPHVDRRRDFAAVDDLGRHVAERAALHEGCALAVAVHFGGEAEIY